MGPPLRPVPPIQRFVVLAHGPGAGTLGPSHTPPRPPDGAGAWPRSKFAIFRQFSWECSKRLSRGEWLTGFQNSASDGGNSAETSSEHRHIPPNAGFFPPYFTPIPSVAPHIHAQPTDPPRRRIPSHPPHPPTGGLGEGGKLPPRPWRGCRLSARGPPPQVAADGRQVLPRLQPGPALPPPSYLSQQQRPLSPTNTLRPDHNLGTQGASGPQGASSSSGFPCCARRVATAFAPNSCSPGPGKFASLCELAGLAAAPPPPGRGNR